MINDEFPASPQDAPHPEPLPNPDPDADFAWLIRSMTLVYERAAYDQDDFYGDTLRCAIAILKDALAGPHVCDDCRRHPQ